MECKKVCYMLCLFVVRTLGCNRVCNRNCGVQESLLNALVVYSQSLLSVFKALKGGREFVECF